MGRKKILEDDQVRMSILDICAELGRLASFEEIRTRLPGGRDRLHEIYQEVAKEHGRIDAIMERMPDEIKESGLRHVAKVFGQIEATSNIRLAAIEAQYRSESLALKSEVGELIEKLDQSEERTANGERELQLLRSQVQQLTGQNAELRRMLDRFTSPANAA